MNNDSTYEFVYTDLQTCLMWASNGNIIGQELAWESAMNWAKHLNYGGHADWRLPTKEELCEFRGCVVCPDDQGWISPFKWFNANGFNNVQPGFYWTGTECGDDRYAWGVSVFDYAMYSNAKDVYYYVWPVRGVENLE
ncbi:MAG: DUF1566 domain-containing protein [Desulfuromonadaceae bacterium]|nr:DUF1566 domain-containing protein [Desulfuromonadaceae bacterium]